MRIVSWLETIRHLVLERARTSPLPTPSASACISCGNPQRFSRQSASPLLELCSACYRAIPWIRQPQCAVCGRGIACGDCRRRPHRSFACSRSAVEYNDLMRSWLALYKYRGNERWEQVMAHTLLHAYGLLAVHLDAQAAPGTHRLLTYVPISDARLAERGFNQAERLARLLSTKTNLPVLPLLTRNRHTAKQSVKTRRERLSDLNEAFSIKRSPEINALLASQTSVQIILVDDVYTTGSTMEQCAKVLTSSLPARVFGLTWAR